MHGTVKGRSDAGEGVVAGRPTLRRLPSVIIPGAAVLLAFAAGAVLIALAGVSPLRAYADLLRGAFGSKNNIAETLVKTTPLLLAGLGMALAYRGRIMNIGAQGQILLGAVGATYVGLYMGQWWPPAGIPMAILAGFLLGALWAGIAGVLKLKFGASDQNEQRPDGQPGAHSCQRRSERDHPLRQVPGVRKRLRFRRCGGHAPSSPMTG